MKVIPCVAEYMSGLRERMHSLIASTATPALSIHGICNPITCNVGLHTGDILSLLFIHIPMIRILQNCTLSTAKFGQVNIYILFFVHSFQLQQLRLVLVVLS